MTGDGIALQSLFTRIDIVEEKIHAINSTLDGVAQELKRLFLKIDD